MDIGICVPVLNEAAVIGELLDSVAFCLEGGRYTICVVDDGSTDGTIELVEARARADHRIALLRHTKSGPGCRRGAASRAGMNWLLANTTHALMTDVDADGANPPSEIAPAVALLRSADADIVIASKYVEGAVVTGRSWVRRAGSLAYSTALRALIDPRIHDYSNSFRVYRRDAAQVLQGFEPRYDTPVYLVEMIAVWLSHGLRVIETPTNYRERSAGASKVLRADFLRGAAGAVDVGFGYRAGRYGSSGVWGRSPGR